MVQTIELKELKRKDSIKNGKKFDINNIISTKNTNEFNFINDNLTLQMPKINSNNSNKDSKLNENFNKSNKKILKIKKKEEDQNNINKTTKNNENKSVSIIIEDKEKGKEKIKEKIKEKEKVKEINKENVKEKEKVKEIRKSKKKKNKIEKKAKKLSFVGSNMEQSPRKNKIKFSDLIIRKDIKNIVNDINLEFMNEIKEENDPNNENKKIDKEIKLNKISKLLNKKSNFDKIVSKQKERLRTYLFPFNLSKTLELEKACIKDIHRNKMKSNRKVYIELKKSSIMHTLLYGYLANVNKCSLDNNMINYVRLHVEFSSIYLPVVNFGEEKSLLITDKLFSFKNKKTNIIQMIKSKFVETKKDQRGVQTTALNFITKELFYYNIHSEINYLEEDYSEIIDSVSSKNVKSTVSKKNLPNFSPYTNFKKKGANYIKRNSIARRVINPSSLSLLEKKKFFDVSKKGIENRLKYSLNSNLLIYKFRNNSSKNMYLDNNLNLNIKDRLNRQYLNRAMVIIHDHKIKREVSNQQTDYFELLKKITGKENIEVILRAFIQEGETLLFTEYFNNNYRRIDINSKDEDGNTFLILSIKQGLNFITKTLLEKGVDVNIQNNEGNTALHYALSGKNFIVADLLKKFGAKEDCYNSLGYTPWDCVGKSIEVKND